MYQQPSFLGYTEFAYIPVSDYSLDMYGDCLSLSNASMDMRTPDIHPVPDTRHRMVVQNIANDYSPAIHHPQWLYKDMYAPPLMMWPSTNMVNYHPDEMTLPFNQDVAFAEIDCNLSQSYSSEEDENSELSSSSSSMRRCDTTTTNTNKFCHLSKKELIQRVIELEREKHLTLNSDTTHLCCWAGCNTMTNSLHQLTSHIKETHIGSGKPAYYCEWESCPRKGKPFLKRHKMQNHMRTHTGERPFECTVNGCDKRFSRLDSLNTHVKTHSNIRPHACPVQNCNKAYFHSRSLRKHAKTHNSGVFQPY